MKKVLLLWSIVLVVSTVGVGACGSDEDYARERSYLSKIKISGFERVQISSEKSTMGTFVGPPSADLLSAISGPSLVVEELSTNHSLGVIIELGYGSGYASDGKECLVGVDTLRNGAAPLPNWKVDEEKSKDVVAGRLQIVRVSVNCEPFDL